MAVTENTYTQQSGDPNTRSFTFPYLKESDVKVTVAGSAKTNGTGSDQWQFSNATTVQFNTTPANGSFISIYRETADTNLSATFYAGSAIKSQDLNDNFTQNLYVTQEVRDDSALALTNSREHDGDGTYTTAIAKSTSAVSTANTASTNASTAVSTANTASSNATTAVNTDLVVGYEYEYEVELPKVYVSRTESSGKTRSTTRGFLTLHRMNFNFGDVGVIDVTLKRRGRSDYTKTYESVEWDSVKSSTATIANPYTHTIPVYDKNENLTVHIKSTHPSPCTLRSLSWEGDYSPKFYRRA